ncbi:MAG: MFS transporter [Planctomycetota bacterium]
MSAAADTSNRWLVRSLVIAQFGPAFMFSGVAVALPSMGEELAMSATGLGLVETTFVASSTAFLLPAGRIADILPRGVIFRVMLTAFGLLSLLLGCVSSGWLVLALRFLQGCTAAMASATGPALLTDLVPPERRGRVLGAMMGTAYAGLALGPFAAGWLVETLGWRSVFFVGGAQILIGGLPVLLRRIDKWRAPTSGLHVPSSLCIVLGIGSVVAAVSAGEREASPWPWALAAAGLLSAFLWWQLRLREPLLDLRLLRGNALLRSALVVQMLLYLNAYCSIFLLSLFLQVGKGMDARDAGIWLAVGSIVMACIAPNAGKLADRTRPESVAASGVVFLVLSSVCGFLLPPDASTWMVGGVLALQGVGFGLFSSPNLSLILSSVPQTRSGFASAIAAQSRGIGMFSGMAVSAGLIAASFGSRSVRSEPGAVHGVLHDAYGVLLVTTLIALVWSRVARPRR